MSEAKTRAQRPPLVVRHTKYRVMVLQGREKGACLDIAGVPLRIGTAIDNDLVLTDDTISRHHCEIDPTPQGVRVRDAGSTNGIFLGAARVFDIVLPFDTTLRLGETELAISRLQDTVAREQAETNRFGDVLGSSPRMRELFADLERIASTDVTLLLEGETGTGKDLVAESVHQASDRAEAPFVVFDCGAVSPSLAESELFGHERGAFTGAVAAHAGVFEQAQGGTVFLDEIGELPKEVQPKLLRVLEKRQVRRLGGSRTIDVDVRLLAATNRNLRAEVARGNFREDLYFRIAAAHVLVPPLRDRLDDLPILIEHFLLLERPPRSVSEIPSSLWEMFRAHRWQGNVRELRNAIQRWCVTPDRPLAQQNPSGLQTACASFDNGAGGVLPLPEARREANDRFERSYVEQVLDHTAGNVTRAAAAAGVSRQMLQKLMRKHGFGDSGR